MWRKLKFWQVLSALLLCAILVVGGLNIQWNPQEQKAVFTIGNPAYAIGVADYTCDGIADNVQFQAAIDALPAGGGKLIVKGGNYVFAANVTRAIANITIEGEGRATYFANNGVTALFTAGGNNWVFQDLRTDAGGLTMGATTGWIWRNVTINATYYTLRTPADGNLTAGSITDSGLTSGQVVYPDGSGTLTGEAAYAYNSGTNTLSVDNLDAPTGRGATYVIAASDATTLEKAQADYVCDGVDDLDTIEAINALMPATGGTIQLTTGTYTFHRGFGKYEGVGGTTGLAIGTTLRGSGYGTLITVKDEAITTLSAGALIGDNHVHVADSSDFEVGEWVEISGAGGTAESVYVASVSTGLINFTTNLTNNHGIADDCYSTWCTICLNNDNTTIENLTIDGNTAAWTEPSISGCGHQYEIMGSNSTDIVIDNISIINSKRDALVFMVTPKARISNCVFQGGTIIEGLLCSGTTVNGCVIYDGDLGGEHVAGVTYVGNTINNGRFYIHGSSATAPTTDCVFTGNTINAPTTGSFGIVANYLKGVSITSNILNDCDFTGIKLENTQYSDCSYNIIRAKSTGGTNRSVTLMSNTQNTFIGNHISGTWTATDSFYIYTNNTKNEFAHNYFHDGNTFKFGTGSYNNWIHDNYNYVSAGEIRTYSDALTAGAVGNAIMVWQNPEAQAMMVTGRTRITAGATAAATGAWGLATTVTGGQVQSCEAAWTVTAPAAGHSTSATDTTYVERGTYDVSITGTAGIANGDILAWKTTTSAAMNLQTMTHLTFKFRSNVALNAGDLSIALDQAADFGTPIAWFTLPAIVANTTTLVCLNLNGGVAAGAGYNSIDSIGIRVNDVTRYVSGKIIYLDDIRGITVGTDFAAAANLQTLGNASYMDATPIHVDYKNNDSATLHDTIVMVSAANDSTGLVGSYYVNGQGE